MYLEHFLSHPVFLPLASGSDSTFTLTRSHPATRLPGKSPGHKMTFITRTFKVLFAVGQLRYI